MHRSTVSADAGHGLYAVDPRRVESAIADRLLEQGRDRPAGHRIEGDLQLALTVVDGEGEMTGKQAFEPMLREVAE